MNSVFYNKNHQRWWFFVSDCFFFRHQTGNGTVFHADVDILIVISKAFPEDGQSADVLRVLLDFELELDGTAVVKIKFIDGNVGYLQRRIY